MTQLGAAIEKIFIESFFDRHGGKILKRMARTIQSKAWKHLGKGGNARQRRLKRRHGINL